jgi:uncharacterized protein YPO0396
LDRAAIDKCVEFITSSERDKQLTDEIRSLEGRANNLPIDSIRGWEGSIERLLHGFALSLLVPDHLYAQVSHYVDRTHLRGRLVYLRIRESAARTPPRAGSPQSAVRNIEIKPDIRLPGTRAR